MDLKIKKKIYVIVKYILDVISLCISKIIIKLPVKAVNYFMSSFLNNLAKSSDTFYTYHTRPKKYTDVYYAEIFEEKNYSHIGLVVQGPLDIIDDFTFNSVMLYKRNFPCLKIVVSTWKNSDIRTLKLFEENNVDVILSEKPKISGSHNINYQIISTLAGIEFFKNDDTEFICKTRSDQRFYSKNTFDYLETLIKSYPITHSIAKGRIIEPSVSVCKYRLWSMTDMFQFGYYEDIYQMWDLELDNRSTTALEYGKNRFRVYDIVNDNIAEIYVHRDYARKTKLCDEIDYKCYYSFIKELFIIIDKEELDLFWHKYNADEYRLAANPLYDKNQLLSRIQHTEWLKLIFDQKVNFEKINSKMYQYEL